MTNLICIFQNFYKNEINRQEMYIRYIYKLHDLHLPAGNYTEAAFTLQLHADQLSWTQRMLHADHLYQAQTETQRKELIYMKIIDYFDKGKVWDSYWGGKSFVTFVNLVFLSK